jgi:hypothetical protein
MLGSWLTLEDTEPTPRRPLRSAPWMVAAFSTLGFRYQPQQTEHQETRKTWRTWRIEDVRPGVETNETASLLNSAFEGKGEHKMHPSHPFLASYLAARHYDVLELARKHGINCATENEVGGFGLTRLKLKPGDKDLKNAMPASTKTLATRSLYLAAALTTAGFPFSHWTEDGRAVLLAVAEGSVPVSLTMLELALPTAIATASECAEQFQAANPGQAGRVTGPASQDDEASPLAADHIFRYICFSILHRMSILTVEKQLDNARDARRTYFFTSAVNPQHAALVNWDEYHANREKIASHLTAASFA